MVFAINGWIFNEILTPDGVATFLFGFLCAFSRTRAFQVSCRFRNHCCIAVGDSIGLKISALMCFDVIIVGFRTRNKRKRNDSDWYAFFILKYIKQVIDSKIRTKWFIDQWVTLSIQFFITTKTSSIKHGHETHGHKQYSTIMTVDCDELYSLSMLVVYWIHYIFGNSHELSVAWTCILFHIYVSLAHFFLANIDLEIRIKDVDVGSCLFIYWQLLMMCRLW